MTWKVVNITDTGTSIKFGADDLDKINKAFNGTNVSDPIIYNIDYNTLKDSTTNSTGDLLKNNGTKYVRFAKGSALQILRVNAGATDLEWAAPAGNFDATAATTTWRITATGSQILEWGSNEATGGNTYIDFHTNSGDGDYRTRIGRHSGTDGDFDIVNTGAGSIELNDGIFSVGPSGAASGEGVSIILPDVDTSVNSGKNIEINQTITATAATAVDYRPINFKQIYLADDVSGNRDLAACGMHLSTTYGSDTIDAKGNAHTLTLNSTVEGCVTEQSEIGSIVSFLSSEDQAISMWSTDLNLHGPIGVQPGMLIGLSQFINNYYNGSPQRNTSAACGLYTKQGSGGGTFASQDTATTYPIDLGIVVCGVSGPIGGPNTNGFNTGIQVGGFGGSWLNSGASKIGTGLSIFDCNVNAIDLSTQVQSSLSGHCIKLPTDGTIGISSGGKLSWESGDILTLRSAGAGGIKTIGAAVGNTDSVHYIAGHRPDLKKYGAWYGSHTFAAGGDGILSDRLVGIVVGTGTTGSAGTDSTGVYRTADTGATINSLSGMLAGTTLTTRINNAYFKSAIYLGQNTACRVYCGLVASATAPASAADPLNALAGVGLWFDSAVNANWRRYHNDSSGAGVSDDTGVAVAPTTLYTFEIEAVTDSKFVFRFNGTSTDISTDIPGSTTTLGFWFYIENTTGASKTIRNYYTIMRTDK